MECRLRCRGVVAVRYRVACAVSTSAFGTLLQKHIDDPKHNIQSPLDLFGIPAVSGLRCNCSKSLGNDARIGQGMASTSDEGHVHFSP